MKNKIGAFTKRLGKTRKRGEKPDSADRLRSASFGRGDYRDRDVSDAGRSERV